MAQAMPKNWIIYALIAIGFAGLIGAHQFAPVAPTDDAASMVMPFTLAAIGTACFIIAGVIAFRMFKQGRWR